MTLPWFRRSSVSMRRFYNLIHPIYGMIEGHLGPKLDKVLEDLFLYIEAPHAQTALEYACGSGLLSLKLAPLMASVVGRDQSAGMLKRAMRRARKADIDVQFRIGDLLAIDEAPKSVDYVFLSFALHLFSKSHRLDILRCLGTVARKGVIIIDHSRTRDRLTEWVERLEGSHYDDFICDDFVPVARAAGFRQVIESEVATCMVLRFIV